jgi:transcriptional regulator with XRE-family HTH domain
MSRKTFGKVMPRPVTQNLKLMGEQIMLARKRRHLTMQDIADRATVTRLTVSKVEHGDPSVAMGIYVRVLYALNLENDIKLIAGDDALVVIFKMRNLKNRKDMEKIYVYADFDFLEQTEEIGVLSYERVRGNDHFRL